MCSFAPYDIPNVHTVGYDVVSNRPKTVAYRAPGSPISAFAAESTMDLAARKIGMDPIEFRLKNIARPGAKTVFGTTLNHAGFAETLQALQKHPGYQTQLGKNQGRGVAVGYWFNGGGESSATVHVNEDGTVVVAEGSPDIGGSRASMALMAAETLGIAYESVRPVIADTNSVGYTQATGGSRVTFATGMTVINACNKVIEEMCTRVAKLWKVDRADVIWEDGHARPAGKRAGEFEPLSFKAIAAKRTATGGPITASASINADGQAPGFSAQFVDVEVDPETGYVKILRYVAAQDVGRAIHPAYCEGQIQGGVVQGIGWALNEEYIYDSNGHLENPGFLDYRIPVASDVPMIEAILVEVPNPKHPYGVKGVAEANIVPPMAAIANAIQNATGVRLTELPMSPPKVLAALDAR
jgi:CO/xanthine dehydrogenase Mo-binding subunit